MSIDANLECPKCKGEIPLSLPEGGSGDHFDLQCPNCDEKFIIAVERMKKDDHHIEWEKRKKVVRKDPKFLVRPRFQRRMKIAAAMLALAFILGMTTGILTSIYGFVIPNPDIFFNTETSSISGSIIDMDGNPMKGASVSVIGESFTTVSNINGIYVLEGVPLGDYTLRVELEGHRTVTKKITVTAGSPNIFDFTMLEGSSSDTIREDETFDIAQQEEGNMGLITSLAIIISSIFALLGAYLVFTKQRFVVAVVCVTLGIMSIGFGFGIILSIASLIIILQTRSSFVN